MMENTTSNEIGKAIVNEVEKTLRLFLDKMCNKYKSVDREIIREAARETMGIEIGETRREFLEKEWDPENDHPFSKYKDGSNFKAKWICSLGHKYPAMINKRVSRFQGCPCCAGQKICDDGSNSLGYLFPHFVSQWDTDNKLSIFQVTRGSKKSVKWICEKGHKWSAIIKNRTYNNTGCPKCSGREVFDDGSNSLGFLRPEFIKEWDPENGLSIFEVTEGSGYIAKWICEKGHKWPSSIKNRTNKNNPRGCSYCSNKKICDDGSNSLGVLRPEFIRYWDPDNELSIFRVSVGSDKLIKWICEKGHKWEASIQSRTDEKRLTGCPKCNESKGEKFINRYIIENNMKFISQYKISYNECPNLRCDFYLEKYNTCIEFDGIQHFEEIAHFNGEEGFLIRIRNDNYKNLYCKENGSSMIRIHYLDINDTQHLKELIEQIDIEIPKLILSKNYPKTWLYSMY